jgi:hypothetical protein
MAHPCAIRAFLAAFLVLTLVRSSDARAEEKPLSLRDIARMRHDHVTPDQIVEKAADQGVDFSVTPGIEKQLSRLGFTPEHIEPIKQAGTPEAKAERESAKKAVAITPGAGLTTSDEQRDRVLEQITKITKLSGANVQQYPSRHVTVWAAKDDQAAFLPDVKKIERHLEGKCQEPLRSGLDKRAAHLLLLKTRYDYEKWVTAMFDVLPWTARLPDAHDAPEGNPELKALILKGTAYFAYNFVVICLEGQEAKLVHHRAAAGVGYMSFAQQITPQRHDPLVTGFANVCESLVTGSPITMIFGSSYQNLTRDLGNAPHAWLQLVQERMRTKKESSLRGLLLMDTTNMRLPHYAEAWTLVGLLARQPEKFAKLILLLRDEKDTLKAIEQIYGWDEKKLDSQWHKDVLAQR